MAASIGRFGGWLFQRPYLLASLTYLFWSLNIVLGRHAAASIPPVTLGVWRWLFAGLILLPFTWPHLRRDWPAIRAHWPILSVLGVTGTTGYAILSYWALQYTQAINGLLIQCTMPITIGIATYFVIGQRLHAFQVAGIVVSLAGVVLILLRGDPDVLHAVAFNQGDLWFVAAVVVFSLYAPLSRKAPALHPLSFLAITVITGTVLTFPLFVIEAAVVGLPPFDLNTVLIVLYIAIFPSIIGYLCYNRAVALLGPNPVAAMYPLIVVFGSGLAMIFLGERPQWYHFAGTVFIVAGVLLATRPGKVRTLSEAPRP